MKIILPSEGLLGTRYVDLREPNYGDLRATSNMTSSDEYLFKYEFVQRLCNFDPKTISMDDVLFLYTIAASAVTFSVLSIKVKCPECGETIYDRFVIGEDDIPIKVLKNTFKKCKKTLDGVEYSFNILSAQDGVDIHTYALDYDDYEQRIEDATVCRVLGYDITEENIDKVTKEIPISVYTGCFLFISANKHGMNLVKNMKCKCGKSTLTEFELDSTWVKCKTEDIIEAYAMIRDCLDFKSFLDFNVTEFKYFIDYINKEVKEAKNYE